MYSLLTGSRYRELISPTLPLDTSPVGQGSRRGGGRRVGRDLNRVRVGKGRRNNSQEGTYFKP
eukprot:1382147-Amorphochlora_amoeboformis.AAC.1